MKTVTRVSRTKRSSVELLSLFFHPRNLFFALHVFEPKFDLLKKRIAAYKSWASQRLQTVLSNVWFQITT